MQCAEMLSKDTGSRQTDSGGDAPCHVCHVYQSGTRTMEYILCSGLPGPDPVLCHNISNPLPPGVRDPEIWMLRK